jgi:inositol phosphorylceramide mannosyltransferase catalytic subunit
MSIPKRIVQTFKTSRLPWLTRWQVRRAKRLNPDYEYCYFDDEAVDRFVREEFDDEIFQLYKRINIGACKGDFFRYAYLLKRGGVYLDIDSCFVKPLATLILPTDEALIAWERNQMFYVQWALAYAPGHPFLVRTMEVILDNLKSNRFPYNVHAMTGPSAYTQAIRESLAADPNVSHRIVDIESGEHFQFRYVFAKPSLYGLSRAGHWQTNAATRPILKPSQAA